MIADCKNCMHRPRAKGGFADCKHRGIEYDCDYYWAGDDPSLISTPVNLPENGYISALRDYPDTTEELFVLRDPDIEEAKHSRKQLVKLHAKFNSLRELLDEKFNPEEITHKAYLERAAEVLLSGIENVRKIDSILYSISGIDESFLKKQIEELRHAEGDQASLSTYQKRLKLYETRIKEVTYLLAENEEAMTKLDEAAVAIADLDIGQGEAKVDMKNSLKDLAEITERTPLYAAATR